MRDCRLHPPPVGAGPGGRAFRDGAGVSGCRGHAAPALRRLRARGRTAATRLRGAI